MAADLTCYERYLADVGARVYHENRQRSRAKDYRKYSEDFFRQLPGAIVSTETKARVHSVDTFVHTYRRNHPDERVPCTKTVYTFINQGVLPVRNIDLPMKTRRRPRKNRPSDPKGTNARHLGRSIDVRDPSVLLRKEYGHWEVDLMLGKKTKGDPVILTLVERKTRFLLTKKVWSMEADTIQQATFQLMEKHGLDHFRTLT